MLPSSIVYYGRKEALPAPVELAAGPLTAIFEPETAVLRYVRLGDHEALRAIYGAVRDQDWKTIPSRVRNLAVRQEENAFEISFEVHCQDAPVDYVWRGRIEGSAHGTIRYTFEGESHSEFLRNRIGLCALHPVRECAGKTAAVETVEGGSESGVFPRFIAPDQPFKNIRAVRYEVAAGQQVEVRFEGDTFEMEDQRNWSDASFKTYSTPQDRPKPVAVKPGDQVRQSVTLSLLEPRKKILPVELGRPPQLSIATTPVLQRPPLGLALTDATRELSPIETERLRALGLSHLRVDLDLQSPAYPEHLRRGTLAARAVGAGLHLALTVSDRAEEELAALLPHLRQNEPPVTLWLLFHGEQMVTDERWILLASSILQRHAPNVLLAAGTKSFFTELNRQRPATDSAALPCYSNNPQVHQADNRTLVENLAGQANNIESAAQFSPRPVVVSPITLKPAAPSGLPPAEREKLEADPRQFSLLGAGWTLGSIAQLSGTGKAHSLTYYQTSGPLGLVLSAGGQPAGSPVSHPEGTVAPAYHVFADLAGFDRLYPTHSSHPLQVEGMTVLDAKNRRRILVANLDGVPADLKIKTGTVRGEVRYLDERNVEEAMHSPNAFRGRPGQPVEAVSGKIALHLLPFAIARVDLM